MSRRIRWILLALIVVIVGAAVALVLTQRPELDDARDKVDATWKPLVAPDQLVDRYQKLEGALSAFDAAGGKDRDVSRDLHAALDAWHRALRDGDAGSQATAANALEAQGTRLTTNALGFQRLKEDKAVIDALAQYANTKPNPTQVIVYNRAVRAYEDDRGGALALPVARVFGYDARPVLQLGTGG